MGSSHHNSRVQTDSVQSGKQGIFLLSPSSKYLPSHALNSANNGGRDGIHLDTSLDEDKETLYPEIQYFVWAATACGQSHSPFTTVL